MHNKIGLLTALVFVQLLLVAWFWFGGAQSQEDRQTLISVDLDRVTTVRIAGSSANSKNAVDPGTGANREVEVQPEIEIELTKQGSADDQAVSGWLVNGAPADTTKVEGLLTKLASLEITWPVGTSDETMQRFETTQDLFQRRLQLFSGEASASSDLLAEVLFGTSPGYQRVHARRSGSNEVYAVALSNFELSLTTDDWLDKAIMAVDSQISVLELNPSNPQSGAKTRFELDQDSLTNWIVNGAAVDSTTAQTYVNRFSNLRVLGLASEDAVAQSVVVANIIVVSESGETQLEILARPISSEAQDQSESLSDAQNDDVQANIANEPSQSTPPQFEDYLIRKAGTAQTYRLATYVAEQLLLHDTDLQ